MTKPILVFLLAGSCAFAQTQSSGLTGLAGSTVNLTSSTLRIPNSTTLPATCATGDSYMDTDATSGQRFYLCQSTNTWALQGGGESKTTADVGGGLSLRGATPKAGVALNLRTVAGTAPLTATQSADLVTFAMPAANGTVAGYLTIADYN